MFPENTKVLVVDDMNTMRKIIRKHLLGLGLKNITESDDGSTAWEEIEKGLTLKQPYELIISDWNMPILKGIDLLKKVREKLETTQVPFLLVTAEAELTQISEAIVAGVTDYMVKPFSTEIFVNKLTNVWNKAGQK